MFGKIVSDVCVLWVGLSKMRVPDEVEDTDTFLL